MISILKGQQDTATSLYDECVVQLFQTLGPGSRGNAFVALIMALPYSPLHRQFSLNWCGRTPAASKLLDTVSLK